jgi:2-succinyl-5-enolpyruvyl-6-hydroxy-3-cyclohexene-1-carboxylate synthase
VIRFAHCQAQWGRLLVHTLHAAGVRDVVISPGSRSTPLALAVQRCPGLRVQSVVDERSAAFLALGQAKVSGHPSLLICTSGTAGAHYYPAVIEADESETPLIIITADRPPELLHNRAPQTIDQRLLFGSRVRLSMELGLADDDLDALRGLRRKAIQAVASSRQPRAGPIHLNFAARKPLEPVAHEAPDEVQLSRDVELLLQSPLARVPDVTWSLGNEQLAELSQRLNAAQRPLLVLGPCRPSAKLRAASLQAFLDASGWPVAAEATSQSRSGALEGHAVWNAFDWCARAGSKLIPDLVLQLGDAPTSGTWAAVTRDVPRIVVSGGQWSDPSNRALFMLQAEPNELLERLSRSLTRVDASWTHHIERENAAAWSAVLGDIAEQPGRGGGFDELMATHRFGQSLQPQDLVSVGNSLPVRLLDAALGPGSPPFVCVSQRGVNGIDGLVASALGAASAHDALSPSARPRAHGWLLVGDVSLRHDLGSLQLLARSDVPLTVVVLNNGGGRLFEQLPIRDHETDLALWTTPHTLPLWQAAAALGIGARRVSSGSELRVALDWCRRQTQPTLIEVNVAPDGAQRSFRRITQRVRDALRAAEATL